MSAADKSIAQQSSTLSGRTRSQSPNKAPPTQSTLASDSQVKYGAFNNAPSFSQESGGVLPTQRPGSPGRYPDSFVDTTEMEEAIVPPTESPAGNNVNVDFSVFGDAAGGSLKAGSPEELLRSVKKDPAAWLAAIVRAQHHINDLNDKRKVLSQEMEDFAIDEQDNMKDLEQALKEREKALEEKAAWKDCAVKRGKLHL